MADLREVAYRARVLVERDGVTLEISDVPADQIAGVVRHARQSLRDAGVTRGVNPAGLEHVGGYAPLDVPDEDGEIEYRRVGFV